MFTTTALLGSAPMPTIAKLSLPCTCRSSIMSRLSWQRSPEESREEEKCIGGIVDWASNKMSATYGCM